jgi:Fe-S-cluster containining protein
MHIETNLKIIALADEENSDENFRFRTYLKSKDSNHIDTLVNTLNNDIAPKIDCTACGNCCQTLMINVTNEECVTVSNYLNEDLETFKEKYIETSAEEAMLINTIPCHFLKDKKCTIYENRFNECREFPHLHKPNFKERLFGMIMHYGRCPIIYNVMEQLKIETGFINN